MEDWRGDNPYYLIVNHEQDSDGAWVNTVIDLDEPGWAGIHSGVMRKRGKWVLTEKETRRAVLAMSVHPGEQPYYVARHVGVGTIGAGEEIATSLEVIAFGIGKKRTDGFTERIWYIREADMAVCGEDIESLARPIVEAKFGLLMAAKQLLQKTQEDIVTS